MAIVTHVLEAFASVKAPEHRKNARAPRIRRDVQEVLSVHAGCTHGRSPARRDHRARNRVLHAFPH
jgi:hypothetical protein